MQVPLQIVFEGVGQSGAIEIRVREEIGKLEKFYDRITAARVVVGRAPRRHVKGDTYQVRIHIAIPGAPDIVASIDPSLDHAHEDVNVAIRDAFRAARRQLQDVLREREPSHKTRAG
jgi:ribosome-associated translation inhibitor RaiA